MNMLLLNHPITNPAIPLTCRIINELHPGNMIVIHGSSPPSAKNFAINLALGENYTDDTPNTSDIAFHFNPRFDQLYVARNTYQNGWGLEESNSPNSIFPFAKNSPFEIMILVTDDCYMVAVEQKHYIRYKHRIPYQRVNTLHILRDVNIERILLTDGPNTPPMMDVQPQVPGNIIYDLTVPFETAIPNGPMRPGVVIYMSGRPNAGAEKFNVDLYFGGEYGRAGDIAFHTSVRFTERVVVRNTQINGGWGEEERDIFKFPFERNVNFDLKIVCENDKFDVFINGQYFCSYQHRLTFDQIDRFRVEGDVFVRSLMFS